MYVSLVERVKKKSIYGTFNLESRRKNYALTKVHTSKVPMYLKKLLGAEVPPTSEVLTFIERSDDRSFDDPCLNLVF